MLRSELLIPQPKSATPIQINFSKFGKVTIVIVYVDDMILAINCPKMMKKLKFRLQVVFKMKSPREPKIFISMKIDRDREN